ncbi:hypothetical protein [Bradyrhizobium sp. CCBAU 51753]|uniref:hypothetical protein n=1 Tax=Bradyrhizobium sp. CCBAU 51753 TaxID=1325100 RepID=UPI00188D037B|nr:hypothetical protein [Bradyrhizobium sp. CCBAU 51753]QOZ29911.1 hypothetical protein XH93_25100 [Bradyrhizobium sp. CCBAU 51753]
MPVARYFMFVGGVLLALLFAFDAFTPKESVVGSAIQSAGGIDKSTVRIKSTQKLPELVVYDTNLPTIVPSQVNAVAAAAPAAARDSSAQARVRDTFAQFVPGEKNDAASKPVVAEAKPVEQPAQPAQAPKKRKIARSHAHPPTQLQPQRFAQPGPFQSGPYQPYRVAQQQQRFGFFNW